MPKRAIATASDSRVAEVATAILARGNAIDAVVAAVFAAAALDGTVLLGPLQLLMGGPGAGLRAVDGRVQQPGRGVPRPRGFRPQDSVPKAARVGVPALPAALSAALAAAGTLSQAQVLSPAIALAAPASPERAKVLRRISEYGPAALTQPEIAPELLAHAGRIMGGLLTQADFEQLRPVACACAMEKAGGASFVATVPWVGDSARKGKSAPPRNASHVQVVVAADAKGVVAVAGYEVCRPRDGLAITELGLVAPLFAAPVLRGEARVRPGEPRPGAAPLAIVESEGVVRAGLGMAGAAAGEKILRERIPEVLQAGWVSGKGEGLVGILRTEGGLVLV